MRWIVFVGVLVLLWPLWLTVQSSLIVNEPLTGSRIWSLRWYREFWADPRWFQAFGRSVTVASISTLLATLAGLPVVHAARHGSRIATILQIGAMGMLVLPAAIIGLGAFAVTTRLGLSGSLLPLIVIHAAFILPIIILTTRQAYQDISATQLAVAQSLGSNPRQLYWWVIWPQIRHAVVIAAISGFMLSLNEAMVAQFITTPETETLPRIIWPKLRYSLSPLVAVAATMTGSVTFALLPLMILGMKNPQRS